MRWFLILGQCSYWIWISSMAAPQSLACLLLGVLLVLLCWKVQAFGVVTAPCCHKLTLYLKQESTHVGSSRRWWTSDHPLALTIKKHHLLAFTYTGILSSLSNHSEHCSIWDYFPTSVMWIREAFVDLLHVHQSLWFTYNTIIFPMVWFKASKSE